MKKLLLLICFMASLYASTLQEAKELFEKQEYGKAIEIFNNYEDDGEAQYYLGKAYLYGMGVKKNANKAFEFAQKSANLKNASGVNLLGVLYQYGDGVEQDKMNALIKYKEAAELGSTYGMINIGQMYAEGNYVVKDVNQSIYWVKLASENGSVRAISILGNLYASTDIKNYQEAIKYFNIYLNHKDADSAEIVLIYIRLGDIYKNIQDNNKFFYYYKKSAQLDNIDAILEIIYMKNPYDFMSEEDYLMWMKKGVKLKEKLAYLPLYRYYLDNSRYEEAIDFASYSYYKDNNIEMGCNLAKEYSDIANNKSIDYQKAYEISNKIIEENPNAHIPSCYLTISSLYAGGYSVAKDLNKSIEFQKKSFKTSQDFYKDDVAEYIGEIYLEKLKDYDNARKWYQIAYELTKDEKYLTIVDDYKKTLPTFEDTNNTHEQTIFPIIDNFYKKEQVASVLESDKYYFIATGLKDVKIYDKKDLILLRELRGWIGSGADGIVTQMAYDENNQLLYCAGINSSTDWIKNDLIKVFDIFSGKIVNIVDNKNSMASTYLNISLDGKYLVSINNNCQIQVINAETNELQYYNFSNRVNFTQVNIVQKDNDYIINALGNDNNLYSFSVNKKRQISKEPFVYQTAFKTFNGNHAQNILKGDLNKIENLTLNDNQIYLQNNQGIINSFNIKNLTLSTVDRKMNFAQKEVSQIGIKAKNDNRTLEVYKNNKLLSTIELLYTPIVKYKILDDKYIVVTTSDMASMLIFNINGRAIANLKGFVSLQKNIFYKNNYLFSYGDDNIIHIWNIDNLDELNNKKEVFDQEIVKSFYKIVGGNLLEILNDNNLGDDFLELQMKQNRWNFKLTMQQLKTFAKSALLKKEDIYPLASLYIKNKEWILFNYKGLFTSSKDGQNLIKYHLNQGLKKEAKIIENTQIFEKFYRPDLLKKILAKEKVTIDLDVRSILLNTKAPDVKILNHKLIDKKNLDLVYQICDAGSGISNETLLINGVSVNLQNTRGFSIEEDKSSKEKCSVYKNSITLQSGSNTIAIKAFDKEKTISNTSKNIEVQTTYIEEKKPDLYLLSIAVSNYKNKDLTLKYSVKDAVALKNIINKKSATLFKNIHAYELLDENSTQKNIEKAFDTIAKTIKINDVFLLYIAGHGVSDNGVYYFLPYNINDTLSKNVELDGISLNILKHNLAKVITNKSLILLDTCKSGAIIDNIIDDKATITRLSNDDNRNYIVASSKNQVALEGYKNHGVFTYTVLDAFDYAYFGKQTELTVTNLAGYLETEVPKITQEIFHFEQIPQKHLNGNTFSIGTK